MRAANEAFKRWSGGMPLWVPLLLFLAIPAVLKLGDVVGSRSAVVIGGLWIALVAVVVSGRFPALRLPPLVLGLTVMTVVTAIGPTIDGTFAPWSDDALNAGILAGLVASVVTRVIGDRRRPAG